MRELAQTRSPLPADAPHAQRMPLVELLARSDFLVPARPLTKATHSLIGAAELSALKPGSYRVSVARGPVVNEAALTDALRRGHLAGVALVGLISARTARSG